jgi:thiol-disulfide isomerase/thioredoxin
MLALGSPCPDFALPDPTTGRTVRRDDFAAQRALLVMFICNHCPFVKHIRSELARLGRDYAAGGPRGGVGGVGIVAINPNDIEKYPDDHPDKMVLEAREAGYTFPYLFDATQSVAKAFRAACTPDFFVFGPDRTLVYRGQLDASRPSTRSFQGNPVPVTGSDLRAALDAVLAGKPPAAEQRPSIGCNIKWAPGNEPDYFRH